MGVRKDYHIQSLLHDEDIQSRWIEANGKPPTDQDLEELVNEFNSVQMKVSNFGILILNISTHH